MHVQLKVVARAHVFGAQCRSLVALLAAAPVAAAAALLPEFRSPHLDVHQRLLVGLRVWGYCSISDAL